MWKRKKAQQLGLQELQALRQDIEEIKQLLLAQKPEIELPDNLILFPLQTVQTEVEVERELFTREKNPGWSVADYGRKNPRNRLT
ncbi:MAG: hypothetical protein MJ157_02065 [Clostridia bacterium]|nr:hypothetical protein [Clostridia bacterium]